ncbi:MAG: response regulator receiver protein [Chloroflexi bacterium]|nr:response regulator receiver protein [Chloroflexota bacterium]
MIRLLVAGGTADERSLVANMLLPQSDIDVVLADAASTLSTARESNPQVVVINADPSGTDVAVTIDSLTTSLPTVAVILLSVHTGLNEVRSAMRAGARDVLSNPPNADELLASIRSAFELGAQRRASFSQTLDSKAEQPRTAGKIICVYSPKGGVGKSTMAVNLSIALRSLTNGLVCLVDGNLPFGDIGIMMNLVAKKTIADLIPTVNDLSPEVLDSVLVGHESGVRVLLAPTRPEFAELIQGDHIKKILEALRSQNDYVVVDTWTSFHEVVLAVFDMSQEILLITTLDMPAVKNIRTFLEVAEALRYPKDQITLVLNRADSTGGLRIPDIEESIQHKFGANLVSAGALVTSSINRGRPFLMSDPDAPISKNVMELARRVLQPADRETLGQTETPAVDPKRRTVFGRILSAR